MSDTAVQLEHETIVARLCRLASRDQSEGASLIAEVTTGASLETDRLGLLQQIGVLPPLVGASRPDLRFHVDNFRVPEAAQQEFAATMRSNMSFIRTLPGFVGHAVLERTSGPTAFNITTVAIWKDQQALDAAVERVRAHYEQIGFDGPRTLARWGATLERGHFRAPAELQ